MEFAFFGLEEDVVGLEGGEYLCDVNTVLYQPIAVHEIVVQIGGAEDI